MTVLQEPVQAAVWNALNHYAYRDAVFLAERLYAEVHSEEALFLLATCYYRSGKAYKAYRLLKGHSCTTPQCKYLLAKCCVDLSRLAEGEQILTGGVLNKQKSHDDIATEFGDSAGFTISLLGQIYCKTDRLPKGSECYQKSLTLNPFLWSPFESLCEIGEKPDPDQMFKLTSLQNFSSCQPNICPIYTTTYCIPHRQLDTILMETPQDTLELNRLNLESSNSKYSSLNTDSLVSYIDPSVISPDSVPLGTGSTLLTKQAQNKPKSVRCLLGGPAALSPLTPSFGILPLEPSPGDGSYLQNFTNTSSVMDPPSSGLPPKKSVARISQVGTKSVFAQSGNSRDVAPIPLMQTQSTAPQTSTTPQVLSPTIAAPPNVQPRRSSRLFTSASSTAKENSKKLKLKFPTKIPNRKTKTKTKGGITQSNMNDSIEILKLDSSIISEGKGNIVMPQVQAFTIQKAAADGLMNLMRDMGKGYLALCSYNCKEAISILSQLPSHHYNTGWVLCQIGRAHFELAEYMQAERIFSEVRRIESYRVEGIEIYSTTLWHLQKDVALSALSKDLTDMDKNSPEVDPGFAYSYTLLGHEFVLTEELEKALACFRNAIRVNSRHYNAWYGLGMIYYKQEKFNLAEIHFKKALDINPQSSVLLCHFGMKSEHALETLNKAISIDPKNPLCKFHRASILFANEKYKAALQELEELKQIVPKESLVYFLIGKVYKKLGQTHLALMNFSWAMDLDPKGANNQIKEAIDKRYLPDDEEPVTQEDSYPFESGVILCKYQYLKHMSYFETMQGIDLLPDRMGLLQLDMWEKIMDWGGGAGFVSPNVPRKICQIQI
ncbi:Cell division cycle protein 27-like [Acipenser ruthenus]|uniref:Cell division cycle protein 27 homolog n=1 Tax=Acipenser ruthenus TaxID=7906 RepID=A0A662YWM1_ACIRT|nr:Cell division cycle protein 27-like [Acipenser ruthenus]